MLPGEIIFSQEKITINQNKVVSRLSIANQGDRPIQVGSHYHFFEVNDALRFDREKAYGCRLDIPAGTAVRFEPGQMREVELIPFGGLRKVFGFHNKVKGALDTHSE